jgi:hypothetical protein
MSLPGLVEALDQLAAQGRMTTYGALAEVLGLDGPGRIARLTDALEALMEADASSGAPLRAALVLGRASGGLPARGFFLKAQALGLYDPAKISPDAFHAAQCAQLFRRS